MAVIEEQEDDDDEVPPTTGDPIKSYMKQIEERTISDESFDSSQLINLTKGDVKDDPIVLDSSSSTDNIIGAEGLDPNTIFDHIYDMADNEITDEALNNGILYQNSNAVVYDMLKTVGY